MQGNENLGCNFFCQYDPPICNRTRQVISDLLRKVDLLEKKVEAQKKKGEEVVSGNLHFHDCFSMQDSLIWKDSRKLWMVGL